MSLTPEQQRKIIDYYFEEPNAKAVLEDEDIGASIQEVGDFLHTVYGFLARLHPGEPKPGNVPMGRGATTADLERMKRENDTTG